MALDIDRFADESTSLNWGDLGLDALREDPLPPGTLRTLRYMCDVEFHTVCCLRDMLVSPSRKDPEVSTFMTMWNREEFWHGEALAHVLDLHGITVAFDELMAKRVKLGWRDRVGPVKQSLLSNIVGHDFVAVHMLWGAVNERSAAAAYRRLAALEDHPVLAPLLRRIAAQETKHIAFYTTQARARLQDNPKAQKLARRDPAAVLAANGRTAREPRDTAGGRWRRIWDERARPTIGAVASNLLDADVTGGADDHRRARHRCARRALPPTGRHRAPAGRDGPRDRAPQGTAPGVLRRGGRCPAGRQRDRAPTGALRDGPVALAGHPLLRPRAGRGLGPPAVRRCGRPCRPAGTRRRSRRSFRPGRRPTGRRGAGAPRPGLRRPGAGPPTCPPSASSP